MSNEAGTFEIGKNRIEALSDGIFAIVMTLLILELRIPNLPPSAPTVEVAPVLIALWPKFVSYIVTFVSLGFFWVVTISCTMLSGAPTGRFSGSTSFSSCSSLCSRSPPAS